MIHVFLMFSKLDGAKESAYTHYCDLNATTWTPSIAVSSKHDFCFITIVTMSLLTTSHLSTKIAAVEFVLFDCLTIYDTLIKLCPEFIVYWYQHHNNASLCPLQYNGKALDRFNVQFQWNTSLFPGNYEIVWGFAKWDRMGTKCLLLQSWATQLSNLKASSL